MRWGCHKHSLEQKRSLMKLTLSRNIIATSSKRKIVSPYCIHRETPLRPSVLNVYQYTYLNCSLSLHVLAVYDSVGNPTHTTNSMVSSSGLPHSSIKACEYQIASYIKTSIVSIDLIHTKWLICYTISDHTMVDYGCNTQRSSFQVMWGCHMRLQSELGMQFAPY